MDFGLLLKQYRFKAGLTSLSDLSEILESKGYYYDSSILSRWQTGDRIPRDRRLLINLAQIFAENNAIISVNEANLLLASAQQGYLSPTEEKLLFGSDKTSFYYSVLPISISTFRNAFFSHKNCARISSTLESEKKLDVIEEELERLYLLTYENYAELAYESTANIINLLVDKSFACTQIDRIPELLTFAVAIRLRTITFKLKKGEFGSIMQEVDSIYNILSQNVNKHTGFFLFIYAAIRRIHILTEKIKDSKYLDETINIALKAIELTPEDNLFVKTNIYLILSKIALIKYDQKLFEQYYKLSLSGAEKLPQDLMHFFSHILEVKVRGIIRFENKTEKAIELINIAKKYDNQKLSLVTIWCQNTELDLYERVQNKSYSTKKLTLYNELKVKLNIYHDQWQFLRFKNRNNAGI